MGFYTVTLVFNDENSKEITILFPSSIVKDLFPIAKEFTLTELLNTITEAVRKCTERLTKTGHPEALVPMADDCREAALTAAGLMCAGDQKKKKIFKVSVSSDYFEDLKRLVKQ